VGVAAGGGDVVASRARGRGRAACVPTGRRGGSTWKAGRAATGPDGGGQGRTTAGARGQQPLICTGGGGHPPPQTARARTHPPRE